MGTRGSLWAQPGAANHESKPRYGTYSRQTISSPGKGRLRFWCFGKGSGVTYRTGRIDPSLAFRARLLGFARIRAENSCGGVKPDSDAGYRSTQWFDQAAADCPQHFFTAPDACGSALPEGLRRCGRRLMLLRACDFANGFELAGVFAEVEELGVEEVGRVLGPVESQAIEVGVVAISENRTRLDEALPVSRG